MVNRGVGVASHRFPEPVLKGYLYSLSRLLERGAVNVAQGNVSIVKTATRRFLMADISAVAFCVHQRVALDQM